MSLNFIQEIPYFWHIHFIYNFPLNCIKEKPYFWHAKSKIESKRSTVDTPKSENRIQEVWNWIEDAKLDQKWLPGVQNWVANAQNRLSEVQTWVPKAQNRLSKVQSWTVEPQNQDKVDTWRPKYIPPSLKSNRRAKIEFQRRRIHFQISKMAPKIDLNGPNSTPRPKNDS